MILYLENDSNFRLKLIDKNDIENLRVWKNKNKESFFLKEDITREQQINWFLKYEKNKENFMFVVQEKTNDKYIDIGCMGYRIIKDKIDVYNIMRGYKVRNSTYTMATAFNMMNNYLFDTYKLDITCKVLISNKARNWYELLGFENKFTQDDYILYKLDINKLEKLKYTKG